MNRKVICRVDLSRAEMHLLGEALARAASQLESYRRAYGRANPNSAKLHDDKAAAMRELRHRFLGWGERDGSEMP